ncbi:hypothetical protein ABZ669_38130, partial [Streptomyces hirsutus]|uniref:hypothetical protein n=1 Tax=Streptomyces hirsutus TaxID=35620 RepID=UPI0033D9221A
RRLDGLGLGHVVAGHRCIFHDRELHRTFYSPRPALPKTLPSTGGSALMRCSRGGGAMTPLPERETAGSGATSLIESEIVIVDEDGTEEPFDASSWFE